MTENRHRKFEMFWRRVDDATMEPVREVYERRCADVTEAAQGLIDHFNSTLRRYEKARVLVSARELDDQTMTEHVWIKATAMTQRGRHGKAFDKMHCQRCGLTGKRYGLSADISIDAPFNRTPGYKNCARASELLKSHRERAHARDDGW